MVVNPYPYGKKQKQQLHPQEHARSQQEIKSCRNSELGIATTTTTTNYYYHYVSTCLKSNRRSNNVINCSKKVFSRGSAYYYSFGSLAFIFLILISLLLKSELAHGASLNSSLEEDLLLNNNRGNVLASVVTSTSTAAATTLSTSSSTPTTATLRPAPSSQHNETTTPLEYRDNAHINFTIPIQAAPDSSIIVKHGSIIYEVINNRTGSTNVGAFSIPFVEAPSSIKLYQEMTASVIGLRVEETAKGVSYDKGVSVILANSKSVIRIFGTRFTTNTIIRFVTEEGRRGTDCDDVTSTKYFHFEPDQIYEHSAVVTVYLPPLDEGEKVFYVCVKEDNTDMPWIHQGKEEWIVLSSYQKWLPVWAHVILLFVLLCLSGLFSGLNLGLMAIDRTEIKIIINAGSEQERKHAKKIRPLRDNGNYLLCSLLLGNVLVNATLTILLDDLTSGLIAVIGSTVGIVIFGEIVPQAVCSRHGLAVGARTVWITKLFMAITFPLSYPISVILDKVLGEEIGNVYNRERLKELIRVTQGENDLEKDEMNIIAGALELKQKTVVEVMTRVEDVFMLPIDAVLDFDTVSEIMSNGYSRIPVYENVRGNVISLLYAKDLAFVDPDDRMPLRTICEFYNNSCHFVFENVTLDILFKVFKQGNKGHMAFVQRVKVNDKSDPVYEVVGLVTMEDVIEELIQEEINDETDVWETDHRRRSRGHCNSISDVAISRWKSDGGTTVSPQLTLAAFQYMSTAVDEFSDMRISKTVLERLLKQNIYYHIKIKNKDSMKTDPNTMLYERGKAADYFIMILEGRAHAEIGRENLVFESGPFSHFGSKSLWHPCDDLPQTPARTRKTSQTALPEPPTFIPDYTVRAVTDLTYFRISRSMYLAAKQATLLEKTYIASDSTMNDEKIDEHLQKHMDEVINNSTEGKLMEKSLAMNPPAEICEKRLQDVKEEKAVILLPQSINHPAPDNHNHLAQNLIPRSQSVIGDNNNVCLAVIDSNGELLEKQTGDLNNRSNNMSRVIICPKDDKSIGDIHQEGNFQGKKIMVDGDEKYHCKL